MLLALNSRGRVRSLNEPVGGEGDLAAAVIFTAAAVILLALVWIALSRSFLRIAAGSGKTEKMRYTEKAVRQKTAFGALLGKEFGRFTASPNYMLNCGLSILLIPACGVFLLIKGHEFCTAIGDVFTGRPDCAAVLVCTVLCLLASMNDMAAPSVSLEGKSLWIPQSLPVAPGTVLRAKTSVQLILTAIPVLFAAVCADLILDTSFPVKLMVLLTPLFFAGLMALFDTAIGVRMPLLHWTNELAPIKQSGAVMIALFGGWAVSIVFGVLYLAVGYLIGAALYLLIWAVLAAAASLILLRWLDTKGAADLAAL